MGLLAGLQETWTFVCDDKVNIINFINFFSNLLGILLVNL